MSFTDTAPTPPSTRVVASLSRVIRADRRWWIAALAALAVLVRLPLLLGDHLSSITLDTPTYVAIVDGLLDGDGFESEAYRTAGYPIFFLPLTFLPGPTTDAVVVVQHLLGVALAGAVFAVADRAFGRGAAIFAASLVALAPTMMLLEHAFMPDFLFGVALFAGAVSLAQAALPSRPEVRLLLITGILFGVAAHIKPSGLALVAAAPLALALTTRSFRATLRGSAIVAAAMVAIVVPWVVHNWIKYDEPTMTIQGGQTLWLRVFDQEKLPIPTDTEEGELAARLHEQYLNDPPSGFLPNPRSLDVTESYTYVWEELKDRGYSPGEATALQGELAFAAIRSDPVPYLTGTVRNVVKYAAVNARPVDFQHVEDAAAGHLDQARVLPAELTSTAWDISKVIVLTGLVISLALTTTLILPFVGERRSRVTASVFFSVIAVVSVGGSLFNYVEVRYAAQLAPLAWMLEGAAAAMVVRFAARKIRDRRTGGATLPQPSGSP